MAWYGAFMLEASGISYRHQKDWLFRQINLEVQPGEIVGLYGRNGAGKSTLARLLAGYLRPAEGHILVDGQAAPEKGYHPVQLIWQHPEKAVNPKMKMKKILAEGNPENYSMQQMLGIQDTWLDRWPSELSGGELQRFSLARALGPQTKYIIADEITTMFDAITQAQIWHSLLEISRERQIGILVISHSQPLLERISSRLVHFHDLTGRPTQSLRYFN